MKKMISLVLACLLLIPVLSSCAGGPSSEPASGGIDSTETGSVPGSETVEPITETPETDPFEGAEPLPEDLVLPENVRLSDGTRMGTIVVPEGADLLLTNAADNLQYYLRTVAGAEVPKVSRPGEGYGSFIFATPDCLPAISGLFEDDLAWLSDLGGPECGCKWADDGFAVRRLGDDVYIIAVKPKGALNGAYDLIEENLGVLWIRADEATGTIYDPLEEAVISKLDYREKSPFQYRGWVWSDYNTQVMFSRNKMNWIGQRSLGMEPLAIGGYIKSQVTSSPAYDPECTEYWQTDADGNRLTAEESRQPNYWSDKVVEALAAYVEREAGNGIKYVFLGEEDGYRSEVFGRVVPEDTRPFEYAPGLFVNPEDENYYSTVFFTCINKIARQVKETYPDVMVATYSYQISVPPPACDIEDNVLIVYAPIAEDMCYPLFDEGIQNKKVPYEVGKYGDWAREWAEKGVHMTVYNYYACSQTIAYAERPIWSRIQDDFQHYAEYGIEGVDTEGIPDAMISSGWYSELGSEACHAIWDMNTLTFWLYQKLSWNPWEDLQSLIDLFCDKVYGSAAESMKEYYRIIKDSFDVVSKTYKKEYNHGDHYSTWFKYFIKNAGIGHPMLDALEKALSEAEEPVRERIQPIYDKTWQQLSAFRSF
ncbi:MAG: DUF4838 domain-containing protein [Candidatus Methanomethylophilaceae archaeon]|nr:DUF4838 domain-containing protein [Candidatus Methanomethylophilaceae archaeon]